MQPPPCPRFVPQAVRSHLPLSTFEAKAKPSGKAFFANFREILRQKQALSAQNAGLGCATTSHAVGESAHGIGDSMGTFAEEAPLFACLGRNKQTLTPRSAASRSQTRTDLPRPRYAPSTEAFARRILRAKEWQRFIFSFLSFALTLVSPKLGCASEEKRNARIFFSLHSACTNFP